MKKVIYKTSILLLTFTVFYSCVKIDEDTIKTTPSTYNTPVIPQGSYTNLQSLYKDYGPITKELTMEASQGIQFFGNGGIHYVLPPDAYISDASQNITGTINIAVTDYVKKSQMLFGGVMAGSDGEYLESGGEANIVLTQNGRKVFLKPGTTFTATIPQDSTPISGMLLFRGQPTTLLASKVNWKQVPVDTQTSNFVIYSGGDSIKLISDSFGYVNIDKFMSVSKVTSGVINLLGVTVNAQTDLRAYLSIDGRKSIMYLPVKSENTVSTSNTPKLPGHVIIMGIVNGDFYGNIFATTPADGMVYNIVLNKISAAEFKKQIDALK